MIRLVIKILFFNKINVFFIFITLKTYRIKKRRNNLILFYKYIRTYVLKK